MHLVKILFLVLLSMSMALQADAGDRNERTKWWTRDRFGMFIHFGVYSLAARHEKVILKEKMTQDEYAKYFEMFNPDLLDARAWAKRAKATGMKYAVLTAKHHDGFCLFDSKHTDYKVTNTPFGRDIVREFVDAFRAEGLKVGLYYSVIDWHHPDFTIDKCSPRWDPATADDVNRGRDMARYRQYMKDQIRELLTDYGKISIAWFDFSYPGKNGKGREDWDSKGIVELARNLQPGIIIDNRLDLADDPDGWDFVTPEQFKVAEWPKVGGKQVPWETCQTFSGSWGYYRDEHSWKDSAQLIELLAESVSKGGNVMLNVGPTGRGTFDARAERRLSEIGEWMALNARSIYGCTQAPDGFKAPQNTVLTYNPETNRLYIHLLSYPMGRLPISFGNRIRYAQFLHDASEIRFAHLPEWQKDNCPVDGDDGFLIIPNPRPDVRVPVIEVVLKSDDVRLALSPFVDRGEIAGVVSVLSDPDYALTVDCLGWADVENKVPMSTNSVFAVFSMTKTFTGCALMVAIDRGLLKMEDLVSKYLPEFGDVENKITIRDCMCHVTGIEGGKTDMVHTSVPVREQARTFARKGRCTQKAGESFQYGNASVNTAAACLEVATGMPYEDFLRQNVLKPLGMEDTRFVPTDDMLRRLVKAYTTKGGPVRPATDHCTGQLVFPVGHQIHPMPAAGLYSTPADMIRFSQMLAHHGEFKGVRIVSRKTFDTVFAVKQTPEHIREPYTVGAWLYGNWFGHEGAMRTDQRANLKTGHSRLFFIQTENAAGQAFFDAKKRWNEACDRYQGMAEPFSERMVRTDENDRIRKR